MRSKERLEGLKAKIEVLKNCEAKIRDIRQDLDHEVREIMAESQMRILL